MRKNMQRIMSIMLVLLMLIPSLAMAQTNISIDYIQEDNNVTVNIKGVRNRPISITIKDDSRYYYINQGVTDDLGKIEFKTILDVDKTYDCQVNIDGETVTKKIVMKKTDPGTDPEEPTPKPTEPETANLYIRGYSGTILDKSNIEINRGETVLSLTTRILDENNISYENRSGYIASIDGEGEGDKGPESGWMFKVNGKFPNVGAGSVRVKNGDNISWLYTSDLGKDIGAPMEGEGKKEDGSSQAGAIDQSLKTIDDKKATDEQKEKAIDNVTKHFADKTKNIKKEEIDNVLKDSRETSKALTNALENAKSEKLVSKIADSSIEITKCLGNIIDNSTDLETIEKISETSRENMGIALASIEKLTDKEKVDKIVDNIIETSTNIEEKHSKKTVKPNKKVEKTVAIKVVENKSSDFTLPNVLLEKANEKKVDKLKLVTSKATIELSPEFLGSNVGKNVGKDVKTNIKCDNNGLSLVFKIGNKEETQLKKAIKVTLPYDKKATNGDKVTAVLIKEDGTKEVVGGVYDEATKTVKFITEQTGKFIVEEGSKEFQDTGKHKWALDAIESMAVKGIINGKSDTTFAPTANITRAEFAALASRMLKLNENSSRDIPFADVDNSKWYYNSVAAVYDNGLINGKSNTTFDPEGNITREEMAKIIGNILENHHYKGQATSELAKFNDKDSVSPWAQNGAAMAVHNGIITGDAGKFNPKSNATRAETAVMLYRLYELVMD